MGQHISKQKGNSKIGKPSECPACGESFPKTTTYDSMNSHVDRCLADPNLA